MVPESGQNAPSREVLCNGLCNEFRNRADSRVRSTHNSRFQLEGRIFHEHRYLTDRIQTATASRSNRKPAERQSYLDPHEALSLPVDFTAWTDRKTCPKCGTPGELFKSTNRETLDTVELFDPILNQLDELELYARGSFIAIEPPELGTDLLTALEVA